MNFILLIALAATTLTAVAGGLLCHYTPAFAAGSAKNAVIPPFSSGKTADLNKSVPPPPPPIFIVTFLGYIIPLQSTIYHLECIFVFSAIIRLKRAVNAVFGHITFFVFGRRGRTHTGGFAAKPRFHRQAFAPTIRNVGQCVGANFVRPLPFQTKESFFIITYGHL
jgi:hypothetical protein